MSKIRAPEATAAFKAKTLSPEEFAPNVIPSNGTAATFGAASSTLPILSPIMTRFSIFSRRSVSSRLVANESAALTKTFASRTRYLRCGLVYL